MKCLSVSQPFADLVVSGRKKIELRSWNTHFRGEFLVHAPQRVRLDDARRLQVPGKFVTGAIVGKAELVDVKKYSTKAELRGDAGLHLASKSFEDKRYGFVLRRARALRNPIPCRGRLGFFEADLPQDMKWGRGGPDENSIIEEIIDDEYRYQWIGRH